MRKIILFLAFLAIFLLFIKSPTDPDFFWHLRYGEEILKTGQVPYEDRFSFTFPGYRWANSYWLSEVLIYFLVAKTGFFLPVLVFAALGAATFLAVALGARVEKVTLSAALAAAFWGAVVALPILGLRPQTLSLIFTGLIFLALNQFWLKKRPKLIFLLPVIFLVWANSHAGFILGLILIWLFWVLESGRFLAQKFLKSPKMASPYLTPSQLKILLGINFLSTLVTLVNPYRFGLWQTVLNDAASDKIKNQIVEWASPDFHTELGLLFFFFLLALVVLAFWGRTRVHLTRFLILLVFGLMALAAVRHIAIFALLATPFLAEELTALPWEKVKFPQQNLALGLFFLVFSLATAVQFVPQTFQASRSIKDLALAGDFPYQAVEYLKAHPQERMFNLYNWGGFLIWQLTDNKTFIDGRMSGWKKNGRVALDDDGQIRNLRGDFTEVIEFWQIQSFLIPPNSPLAAYLKIHPDWEKRYEDKIAIIFVRRLPPRTGEKKMIK